MALFLKERIERHFLRLVTVFVSSDQTSIEAGEAWLDALKRGLKSADLQIVLCSKASVSRPWVNFEAGAAWLHGIPVVPLCHSGLEPVSLPMPLAALQGGKVSDPEALKRLYIGIAKLIPCDDPDIDMKSFAEAAAALQNTAAETDSEANALRPAETATAAAAGAQNWTLDQLHDYAEAGNDQALQMLAVNQSPEAFQKLMDLAINHIDEKIKIAAIKALSNFRTPGDIKPLCELLVQERWQVAEACAKALGRFKNPVAIPYLIRAADQNIDWVTTRESAVALGAFAPQESDVVCPGLVRALDLGSFAGEAASQSLRRYGASALSYLLTYLEGDPSPRAISLGVKTVVLIGEKAVVPRLQSIREKWQKTWPVDMAKSLLSDMDKAISQLSSLP